MGGSVSQGNFLSPIIVYRFRHPAKQLLERGVVTVSPLYSVPACSLTQQQSFSVADSALAWEGCPPRYAYPDIGVGG